MNKLSFTLTLLTLSQTQAFAFGHKTPAPAPTPVQEPLPAPVAPPAPAVDHTFFGKLSDLYDQSTLPSRSDLMGMQTGRCFFTGNKDSAAGFVLLGQNQTRGEQNGPLFPPTTVFVLMAGLPDQVDYYDHLPAEKAIYSNFTAETFTNDTNDQSLIARGSDGMAELKIKKHDPDYLVVKWMTPPDRYHSISDTNQSIAGLCYTFIKNPGQP